MDMFALICPSMKYTAIFLGNIAVKITDYMSIGAYTQTLKHSLTLIHTHTHTHTQTNTQTYTHTKWVLGCTTEMTLCGLNQSQIE